MFKKIPKTTCGWGPGKPGCRRGTSTLKIGENGKRWDKVAADNQAEYVCGTKCLESPSCGGFIYRKSRKKCYYRKIATCGVKKHRSIDCYQRIPAETSRTAPPPDAFAIEVSKTCGSTTGKWSKCPKGNKQMTIGKKKKRWDWGQSTWEDTVATSCGLKCLASSECGGFNYNRRLGKCYYRKNAECGRPQRKNKNNDCWVKSN
jgi:hypothetical protein